MLGHVPLPPETAFLEDPNASEWLKQQIQHEDERTAKDAYYDAYKLLLILGRRCQEQHASELKME